MNEEGSVAADGGRYDYIVLSRSRVGQHTPQETAWTLSDSAAQVVLRRDITTVFRLVGQPNPSTC